MTNRVLEGGHLEQGQALVQRLRGWARELGFSQIAIADIDLSSAEPGLLAWLAAGFHGDMHYMQRHGNKRARPAELVPGTVRVITARMDYLPRDPHVASSGDMRANPPAITSAITPAITSVDWADQEIAAQQDAQRAVISVYARGRDYHKVMRARLQTLAMQLAADCGPLGHRVFTDSAPVLEVELATRAGMAWRGKHTLALSRDAGSMFFLGEIFVDLALPVDEPTSAHCGSCSACIQVCPTQAIVAPYQLDARRCISYLTIEHAGPIAPEFRAAMGNRIYGCDDCQLVCPWNKYAQRSVLPDFDVRRPLGDATLLQLWQWDEAQFLRHTEGSAIRRIGFQRWRRNLAVALGNAWREGGDPEIAQQLQAARAGADTLVLEHIDWALAQRQTNPVGQSPGCGVEPIH
jgi:epoxyqueuosine reductase